VNAVVKNRRTRLKQVLTFALALGLWFTPVPAGLTIEAWHLFAIFASAIVAVILNAFPLLTSAVLAVAAAVLSGTLDPLKAFAGFANSSVLLVVVAFVVASAVVKCGLGRRISLLVVRAVGRTTLGLGYSIFLTDALVAPAFPSNTARGGVLYPIVLALAQGGGSVPNDDKTRRLGGYLMFCGISSLGVSSALWLTAMSANPIAAALAEPYGVTINFGSWFLAASVPVLTMILLLPIVLIKAFPPGTTQSPDAPASARAALLEMGPLSRDEKVVAVIFAVMVTGWILATPLKLNVTAVAFGGLGALLASGVLTPKDVSLQGEALVTFLWLAVLFALSGQLNELGFMAYVGSHLTSLLEGIDWRVTYVILLVLYVALHYGFVSQTAQILALFDVFLGVGVQAGVPPGLMAFALLIASGYYSSLTPQGGSQNVIFVGSNYLTQPELYRLGLIATLFCMVVFLVIGTPWVLLVAT
jgi:divalent anion:Na+ symporter, DASS family